MNWFSEGTTRKKCGKLVAVNIGCVSAYVTLQNIVIAFSKLRSSSQMPLPDYKNAFALKLIIPLEVVIRIF